MASWSAADIPDQTGHGAPAKAKLAPQARDTGRAAALWAQSETLTGVECAALDRVH